MPVAWLEDPADAPQIAANAGTVLTGIAAAADQRNPPTVSMAQQWHRDLYDGISRPVDYYAGEVRDSDANYPDLIGYEVQVGNALGVPSAQVPQLLTQFEHAAQNATPQLDAAIAAGADPPAMTQQQLYSVLALCASLHGEWVRIHPFANGNGRTARLWANWAALRYGLPPFVTIRPRPGQPYGVAAAASMSGDDAMMLAVMGQMLRRQLTGLP